MTKFTYTQLKKLPVFKQAHKMYYKKYPFCVRFKSFDYSDPKSYSKNFTGQIYLSSEVKSFLTRHEVKYRSRLDYHLAIYLLDLDSVFLLYNKFKDDIVLIEGPLNETHHDVMTDDLNVVVRDKLFYKEYRYKISSTLYRSEMDRWIELIDTCNSFDKDSYRFNKVLELYIKNKMLQEEADAIHRQYSSYNRRRYLHYVETASVYLKDYDDVCTLHFMFKDIITNTVKIVLTAEVK